MARSLVPWVVPYERWPRAPRWLIPHSALLLLLLLSLAVLTVKRRWRPVRVCASTAIFLVCVFVVAACGGGNSSAPPPPPLVGGPPAGTYTLTVTGTQQGVSRTVKLTLTVN
jgi:peptidoglycan/LPS O-acetylase OafA/YrhL